MDTAEALELVRRYGILLESARGPIPSLVQLIIGGPVKGSWWSHPHSHEIYSIIQAVRESEDILVCRLVNDRISYLHRRLWPDLIRHADHFPPERICEIREIHTAQGHHEKLETPFPDWVPEELLNARRGHSGVELPSELRFLLREL